LIKVGGKQIKRSLRTTIRLWPNARLQEFREKAAGLSSDSKTSSFNDIAQRWLSVQEVDLKPSSYGRRQSTVKGLLPIFGQEPIARITQEHIERWKRSRGANLSERSFNMEIETLRLILDYARDDLRLIFDHPAKALRKKTLPRRHAVIPSKVEFIRLLTEMQSDGAQGKGRLSADLVEFLGYSGCRLGEAVNVKWQDINFERGVLGRRGRAFGIGEAALVIVLHLGVIDNALHDLRLDGGADRLTDAGKRRGQQPQKGEAGKRDYSQGEDHLDQAEGPAGAVTAVHCGHIVKPEVSNSKTVNAHAVAHSGAAAAWLLHRNLFRRKIW
jgi:integrase